MSLIEYNAQQSRAREKVISSLNQVRKQDPRWQEEYATNQP
jgi:hypothetical protein